MRSGDDSGVEELFLFLNRKNGLVNVGQCPNVGKARIISDVGGEFHREHGKCEFDVSDNI